MTLDTVVVGYMSIASICVLVYTIRLLIRQSKEDQSQLTSDKIIHNDIQIGEYAMNDTISVELSNQLFDGVNNNIESKDQNIREDIDNAMHFQLKDRGVLYGR
jgi:transcription termination factor NusB